MDSAETLSPVPDEALSPPYWMANSPPISTPNVTLLTSSFPFSLHLTEYPRSTFPLISPLNILNNGHFGAGIIKPEARRSVSVSDTLLEPHSTMPNVRMTTVTLPKTTWMCFPAHTQVQTNEGWVATDELPSEAPRSMVFQSCRYTQDYPLHTAYTSTTQDSLVSLFTDEGVALVVRVRSNAIFYVKDKGWCALRPSLAARTFGAQIFQFLSTGDECVPVTHCDSLQTPHNNTLHNCDVLTETRQIIAYNLNNASGYNANASTYNDNTYNASTYTSTPRVKRPMNSFMLFAKQYRMELTKLHPGKDNRDISVLLGEQWRGMPRHQKRRFAEEANLLAAQHKKSYPNCWKRKKTTPPH